jgi:hypothetical protein
MADVKKEFIKSEKGTLGYIDYPNKIYVSFRTRNHKFHMFGDGFGMSVSLLDYLQKRGIPTVVINFENAMYYIATVNSFVLNGEWWNDNGDEQLILPLSMFNKTTKTEVQTVL